MNKTNNSYCYIIVDIPDNYIVFKSNEICDKIPKLKNKYIFEGLTNKEELNEQFILSSFKNAK